MIPCRSLATMAAEASPPPPSRIERDAGSYTALRAEMYLRVASSSVTPRELVAYAYGQVHANPESAMATLTLALPGLYQCDRGLVWLAGGHDDPAVSA